MTLKNGTKSSRPSRRAPTMNSSSLSSSSSKSAYQVRVSRRFVLLSSLACLLVAFAIGRTARMLLIVIPQRQMMVQTLRLQQHTNSKQQNVMRLPNPVLKDGRQAPRTTYTSKNFDTARSASINSRWVVTEDPEPTEECSADNSHEQCQAPSLEEKDADDDEEEEVHLPVGQHLLMDIRHVDASFLASEERLAKAMLTVVNECGLTLLSYHCHGLEPAGVSCVGVLLESHVSFHTWPSQGVITLDLFTCGPNSLLPIVSNMERLFSVPIVQSTTTEEPMEPPESVWAYKVRGFGAETTEELTDLFTFPIGAMTEYKKEIASVDTQYQRVDIYDVLRPTFQDFESFKRSQRDESSYEYQHADIFQPDRIIFSNGVLQSRRSGDASYHESLVHPAMFTHVLPRRVAIIAGGEGGILREVLKHNTVEQVVVVVEDEKLLDLIQEHFPEYSDCGTFGGGPKNCFDDDRVEVVFQDLDRWLVERFSGEDDEDDDEDEDTDTFDVIIMDENDYIGGINDGDCNYLSSLMDALSPEGVFVAQVGEEVTISDPPEEFSKHQARDRFGDALVELGFQSIRDYGEGHSGFERPWQFVLAFKNFDSRAQWFSNEARVTLEIQKRALPALDGGSPFLYFDGATKSSFMYPSRASETVHCRSDITHEKCAGGHGFDPEKPHMQISTALKVSQSTMGELSGRGLFAKVDIPEAAFIGLDQLVHTVHYPFNSYKLVHYMRKNPISSKSYGEVLEIHSDDYGCSFSHRGATEVFVASSVHMFTNHGCDGSSNFGYDFDHSETDEDTDAIPDELLYYKEKDYVYNPAAERQPSFFLSEHMHRSVSQGEEILYNYLAFSGQYAEDWRNDVEGLRAVCAGAAGQITRRDTERTSK